jgi:hypothetical protein
MEGWGNFSGKKTKNLVLQSAGQKDKKERYFCVLRWMTCVESTIPISRREKKLFKSTTSVAGYHLLPVNQTFLFQIVFPWFP